MSATAALSLRDRAPSSEERKPPPRSTQHATGTFGVLGAQSSQPPCHQQARRRRHREGKEVLEDHTASTQQNWHLRPGSRTAEPRSNFSPHSPHSQLQQEPVGGGGVSISAPYPLIQRRPGWVTRGERQVFQHTPHPSCPLGGGCWGGDTERPGKEQCVWTLAPSLSLSCLCLKTYR